MWSRQQISLHLQASKLLSQIKNEAFDLIRNNTSISEYEVQQFILKKFKEYNMITDRDPPIVGFNENSALPHYFPKKQSKRLRPNTLILIDLWARVNKKGAPFADITWMGYYGEPPKKVKEVFSAVLRIRDAAVEEIRTNLRRGVVVTGADLHRKHRETTKKEGYTGKHEHYLGHCIGLHSPHGNRKNLRPTNTDPLLKNYGYTIEPGIYLNEFGIRSEIDLYITDKLIITTEVQKELIIIEDSVHHTVLGIAHS